VDLEWEIKAVAVQEANKVDVADTVTFQALDALAGAELDLQFGSLVLIPETNINATNWPNRETVNSKISITAFDGPDGGIIVKRRDSSSTWKALRVHYKASAIVGNRSISAIFLAKERRLT
jgi:hypothetical protein